MEAAREVESAVEPATGDAKPAALLRGTARGLEVIVDAAATTDAIATAMVKWLDKAPGFFKGSDVRVRVENGPLASGCLARLDAVAQSFELRIVEVSAAKTVLPLGIVAAPAIATGSTGTAEPVATRVAEGSAAVAVAEAVAEFDDQPTATGAIAPIAPLPPEPAAAAPVQLAEAVLPEAIGTRVVVGPVRSGVILDHEGSLFIFGDVNPGAEVRATGNIVVLGRLRGTAHAGIGSDLGFILALRLEPQQLRIGRRVARSGEDTQATDAEIAFITDDKIVVERYQGKLPRNLASTV